MGTLEKLACSQTCHSTLSLPGGQQDRNAESALRVYSSDLELLTLSRYNAHTLGGRPWCAIAILVSCFPASFLPERWQPQRARKAPRRCSTSIRSVSNPRCSSS